MERKVILKIENLNISFTQYKKGLRKVEFNVINDLNVEMHKGEILAIVGSSGSGKSLVAHSILGILPKNANVSGNIIYNDKKLTKKDKEKLRGKEIVIIPQSTNYLDPLMKVSKQVQISIKDKKNSKKIQRNIFSKYRLEKRVDDLYPFELSGGMARRVILSTAIAANSNIIIADEPTPGLDEENLDELLKDFREIANKGTSIMMITHDIDAAIKIADKVAIFYAGTVLEIANKKDFEDGGYNLRHPYTKALYNALPQNGFTAIKGSQPLANEVIEGCLFNDRCKKSTYLCKYTKPQNKYVRDGMVRCLNAT